MDNNNEFLDNFKRLEDKLVIISGLKGDFVSFSRALDKVHYSKLNPVVSDKEVYQTLKTASDIRNILSHETNACVPSNDFVKRFDLLVEEILNPLEAYDIATKKSEMLIAKLSYPVSDVVKEMTSRGLSHVPVIEDDLIIGVFSRSTFFEYYAQNGMIKVNGEHLIKDFIKVTPLNKHGNESYAFTARKTKAYNLIKLLGKDKPGSKRIGCIFVTESGNSKERLLGVISEVDLLKLPIYERRRRSS